MTIWELSVCIDGVNNMNNPEGTLEAPTDEEFERMLEAYDIATATRQ
jgi:hypothetical protein